MSSSLEYFWDFQLWIIWFICYQDIDDCLENPCNNNGSCVDGIASYNCECLAGFTGADCEMSKCPVFQEFK